MQVIESSLTDIMYISTEDRREAKVYPAFSIHEACEIYIVVSGERHMYIGGVLYTVSAGDAAMIPANIPHRSYGSVAYRGICVQFSRERLFEVFGEKMGNEVMDRFRIPVITLGREKSARFYEMTAAAEGEPESMRRTIAAVFAELIRCAPAGSPSEKRSMGSDLSPIGEYIQKNYLRKIELDDICSHFGISKSYLCRLFKKQTGVTVVEYINDLRIQYACILLHETELEVNEIWKKCGFGSAQHFNRVFKRVTDETPLAVRKRGKGLRGLE